MPDQQELFFLEPTTKIYYFLLRPDNEIYSLAMKFKQLADAFLGINYFVTKLPHITILQFYLEEKYEEQLISETQRIVNRLKAPKLSSSKIETFDPSGVIYINVENQLEAIDFKNDLIKGLLQSFILKSKNIKFNAKNLHITIVRHLEKKKLKILFERLKSNEFNQIEYYCSHLILLKAEVKTENWSRVASFSLSK